MFLGILLWRKCSGCPELTCFVTLRKFLFQLQLHLIRALESLELDTGEVMMLLPDILFYFAAYIIIIVVYLNIITFQ